ncbi:hypothetical protein BP6252_03332 [Coleophoma cylindrospora]|uniref:S-adenosyl-L-methionine-dependent methyltransferase n=1 Tax=Coleophoma cylindrospora TaxID=1849047 RepID=A0A3D8S7P6_9HELO|nr:hypothetical protein BP6252_03332 [Coleophoma cylindrospora]
MVGVITPLETATIYSLFLAPIKDPKRVLDAGTGTGIWAIDFADQFPDAEVIGSDLSPIQPGWIPPNLVFEVDDIEDEWRHNPFSYIHFRSLSGAIKDWKRLLKEAYDNLEPGGYLEVTEFECLMHSDDDTIESATMIRKWQEQLHVAGETIGRTFNVAGNLRQWLTETGFINVEEVPGSPWPRDRTLREVGLYQQQNMFDASSSYGQAHFTRVLGWSPQEFAVLSAGVRNELRDKRLHLYSKLYVVYGQKPGLEQDSGDEAQEPPAVTPVWTHDPETYRPEEYHPELYEADP